MAENPMAEQLKGIGKTLTEIWATPLGEVSQKRAEIYTKFLSENSWIREYSANCLEALKVVAALVEVPFGADLEITASGMFRRDTSKGGETKFQLGGAAYSLAVAASYNSRTLSGSDAQLTFKLRMEDGTSAGEKVLESVPIDKLDKILESISNIHVAEVPIVKQQQDEE